MAVVDVAYFAIMVLNCLRPAGLMMLVVGSELEKCKCFAYGSVRIALLLPILINQASWLHFSGV